MRSTTPRCARRTPGLHDFGASGRLTWPPWPPRLLGANDSEDSQTREQLMIDVDTQISQVRRELGTRTLEAGEARVSTISQVYPTDIDDLWDVVTNAERIARWFMPVEGELKEGGHYQLIGNASGTITNCDKPRSYAATWEYA